MFRTVLIVRTVLIGVDGEPAGRDAIALAKRLVASDGKLMLAYVHFGDAWPTRGSSPAFEAAESDRSCELLEAARADASVEADLVWTGSPSVGRGLHELAERHRADLVVVGSCRRSLLGRAMIGDHTREALNAAPCAVAVAPRGYAERHAAVRVIGVGYSGSPESDYALIVARQLATELQAKVSAFEVVSLPLDRGTITELDPLVADTREQIARLGDVEPHAAYGEPAEELAVYSASVDLLIVGSRGYGPIGRLCTGAPRGAWRARRAARCSCSHAVRRARSPTTRIAKVSGRLRGDLARKGTANRRRVASGWVLSAAIAGALLATAGCGSSKSARSAPGRVATRPRREAAVVVSDLSYRSVSGETLGITLRQPGRPRALIVLVHGGGFRGGARSDMTVWALMLTADGYATATIDYRLSGRASRQGTALRRAAQDDFAALVSLQSRAALHALPVVLWGYSAGALTVLRVAAEHPGRVRAVVSLAGFGEPARIKRGDPPMLLFNGTADRVEPVSLANATCRAARIVSARCQQVVYPGATHTITAARAQAIHRDARRWLDGIL